LELPTWKEEQKGTKYYVKNLKIILKIENDSEIELNLSITKRRC